MLVASPVASSSSFGLTADATSHILGNKTWHGEAKGTSSRLAHRSIRAAKGRAAALYVRCPPTSYLPDSNSLAIQGPAVICSGFSNSLAVAVAVAVVLAAAMS